MQRICQRSDRTTFHTSHDALSLESTMARKRYSHPRIKIVNVPEIDSVSDTRCPGVHCQHAMQFLHCSVIESVSTCSSLPGRETSSVLERRQTQKPSPYLYNTTHAVTCTPLSYQSPSRSHSIRNIYERVPPLPSRKSIRVPGTVAFLIALPVGLFTFSSCLYETKLQQTCGEVGIHPVFSTQQRLCRHSP
jgi:hypothetical protein